MLTEIEYRAYSLGAKFQIPLSRRHNLYIDINGFQYDYDKEMSVFAFDDSILTIDDDGTDFGISAGWRVRHDNGFGVKVGVDYLRMGSDVDIGGIGAGISYSF